MIKRITAIAVVTILTCTVAEAQRKISDRVMFDQAYTLKNHEIMYADPSVEYNTQKPKQIYSIHDEDDETIVTFSHSIYHDSQWICFSPGMQIVDRKTGDVYKSRGYKNKASMERLLIVKGCKGKNILVQIRFPKLKRKVKYIDIQVMPHEADRYLTPSNSVQNQPDGYLAKNLRVKDYRNRFNSNKKKKTYM